MGTDYKTGSNDQVPDTDQVLKYTTSFNLQLKKGFNSEGYGQDAFHEAHGITVDNNYAYISDTANQRIQKRDKNLVFISSAPFTNHALGIEYDKYAATSPAPPERIFSAGWESGETDYFTDVECADFDGDGDLDIAATRTTGYSIYENTSTTGIPATFSFVLQVKENTGKETGISVADVDMDGDIDIAISNDTNVNGYGVAYLENKGGFNFQKAWSSDQAGGNYNNFKGCDVNLADLNGDRAIDLTVSAQDSGITGEHLGIVVFKGSPSLS